MGRARFEAQLAAEGLAALLHDGKPIMAAAVLLRIKADAIVFDGDAHLAVGLAAQAHPGPLRLRMANHVGERLADDLQDVDFLVGAQRHVLQVVVQFDRHLAELRVWRFGLYYFFVFGGFVALALWLPKYYIAEYGLDLKTASFITMLFTLPSGLIRALGGWFSDHYGARSVNWGVFWVCLVCLFFLSYPQTTMTIHGIQGDLSLGIGLNVWLFTFLVFVVGIAQGFGKASVYRIIHDYYPSNMGTVGGMVGVIGGLGGFCLPILFGYAADHIGVRSSCFMLLFGLTVVCMVWMHYAIKQQRRIDGQAASADVDLPPTLPTHS